MKNNHKFFNNPDCEYYPCHDVDDPTKINCLFCFCPLYSLGDQCGGNFTFTEKGIKNCSACTKVHLDENGGYDYVMQMWPKIAEICKSNVKDQHK